MPPTYRLRGLRASAPAYQTAFLLRFIAEPTCTENVL